MWDAREWTHINNNKKQTQCGGPSWNVMMIIALALAQFHSDFRQPYFVYVFVCLYVWYPRKHIQTKWNKLKIFFNAERIKEGIREEEYEQKKKYSMYSVCALSTHHQSTLSIHILETIESREKKKGTQQRENKWRMELESNRQHNKRTPQNKNEYKNIKPYELNGYIQSEQKIL